MYVVYSMAARQLREAIAEADRLDPGWQFEDLEATRAPVPDAENAAPQVLLAWKLVTGPPPVTAPDGSVTTPVGILDTRDWETILLDLPPPVLLNAENRAKLTSQLADQARAVEAARKVADLPRGRYSVEWASDYVGTPMPHLQQLRQVARLLGFDALRRAYDSDFVGALLSCRAIVNTGRSVGDEPTEVSQMVRASCVHVALATLERILAQGEAPAAELEAIQRILEEEAEYPRQLISARAERALVHGHLQVVRTGHFNRADYGMRSSALGPQVDGIRDRIRARTAHARRLRYLTAVVEIAKLPPEEQPARWDQLADPQVELPELLKALSRGVSPSKAADLFDSTLAQLRCTFVAVAAERYRLAEHRWPDTLEALVPRYVKAVPTDPFDGKPLRYRRTSDGVVIYALGPDRQDDGGKLDRRSLRAANTDVGFELWNVQGRRRPPAP
jgi:hypothetical protein